MWLRRMERMKRWGFPKATLERGVGGWSAGCCEGRHGLMTRVRGLRCRAAHRMLIRRHRPTRHYLSRSKWRSALRRTLGAQRTSSRRAHTTHSIHLRLIHHMRGRVVPAVHWRWAHGGSRGHASHVLMMLAVLAMLAVLTAVACCPLRWNYLSRLEGRRWLAHVRTGWKTIRTRRSSRAFASQWGSELASNHRLLIGRAWCIHAGSRVIH